MSSSSVTSSYPNRLWTSKRLSRAKSPTSHSSISAYHLFLLMSRSTLSMALSLQRPGQYSHWTLRDDVSNLQQRVQHCHSERICSRGLRGSCLAEAGPILPRLLQCAGFREYACAHGALSMIKELVVVEAQLTEATLSWSPSASKEVDSYLGSRGRIVYGEEHNMLEYMRSFYLVTSLVKSEEETEVE